MTTTTSNLSITNANPSFFNDADWEEYNRLKKKYRQWNRNLQKRRNEESSMKKITFTAPSRQVAAVQYDLLHTVYLRSHRDWLLSDMTDLADGKVVFSMSAPDSDEVFNAERFNQVLVTDVEISDVVTESSKSKTDASVLIEASMKSSAKDVVKSLVARLREEGEDGGPMSDVVDTNPGADEDRPKVGDGNGAEVLVIDKDPDSDNPTNTDGPRPNTESRRRSLRTRK